ncbi:MAG: phosphodiester glycosidase family protein [Armatimonadota bacterium]|nr:phosphodiester glycosidase family protein [Armatimonadota bacterium]
MQVAFGLFVVIFFGAFLSFVWSAISAGLQFPVSVPNHAGLVISIASAFAGSAFAARRSGRWWHGGMVALAAVFFYWGVWLFASSRFRLPEALSLGIFGVGNQILSWLFLLLVGVVGGFFGSGFTLRPRRIGAERPSSVPLLMSAFVLALLVCGGLTFLNLRLGRYQWTFSSAGNSPDTLAGYFREVKWQESSDVVGGKRLRAVSTWDGTQFDLFLFDLTSDVRAGIYDHDICDKTPCDNRNYSYFGLNAMRSLGRIRRDIGSRGSEGPLVVFNGSGFDSGPEKAWCASHNAPMIYAGKMRYKVSPPRWTLALKNGRRAAVSIRLARAAPDLPGDQDYGICGVNALISGGRPAGAGPTDLVKTSRTSIGWDGKRRLYVLIVRDPDGEADSRRQSWMGQRQTGGWSARQLREFWRLMGVSHAVNLSGGDSTQAVYKSWQRSKNQLQGTERKRYVFIPSTQFGATIGYLNNRPLRLEIPTMPPYLMARGSLNYVYLWK